ncbi:hypothetical protein GLOIN_2v1488408 [Rhizophagus irregularis DAOM 181602=DAOM 197198]|uniref:Uncharacterized protein n=1 Tax=Rhizophagus irregularis (strain DAOM 181602 / DAOM 197198 / MUCL 43194) TaxID=747089 RepID=A0A2P4NZY0_RHIID|nr:hypothetical protein GLOIN_2v1488408 [Rhizophagus irregularis DAOM 181602=DAOM 197198]POG58690.1 hypothetical protein GLOIN_2v1488408 [Rhizophagus irregularis DAOM 181602=DAOM 197198]GBC14095.2 hypothetical protein GLOIN_2v1488408 [Rhizophagus irregularis DAOM 181602=DAOM 197198]|eukprot:XP_025165556.1 hypothetical protein GLOIN_2v1488408 [Rhizophagus irregularis DAOM 181602=DAOM 197198]
MDVRPLRDTLRKCRNRENETPDQWQQRLERDRMSKRIKRASENAQQREKRLSNNRVPTRSSRDNDGNNCVSHFDYPINGDFILGVTFYSTIKNGRHTIYNRGNKFTAGGLIRASDGEALCILKKSSITLFLISSGVAV